MQQRQVIIVCVVSVNTSLCNPAAAKMFCLCGIIAPAVAHRDESIIRLRPTDADHFCSEEATVSITPTHTNLLIKFVDQHTVCTNAV